MPTLAIPDSLRMVVFREFVRLVTLDDEMQRIGVAFRSWEGNPDDDTTPSSVEQTPWIRFTPSAGRQRPYAMGFLAIPLTIHVDMLTPTLGTDDSMNLWEAMETIILSRDFQSAMRAVGAANVVPVEAAAGTKPTYPKHEPVIPGAIFAAGSIEITIYRRT